MKKNFTKIVMLLIFIAMCLMISVDLFFKTWNHWDYLQAISLTVLVIYASIRIFREGRSNEKSDTI